MPSIDLKRRIAPGLTLVLLIILLIACGGASASPASSDTTARPNAPAETIITLDPAITYQTMTGWEATAQAGHWTAYFPQYKDELFELAVNDLGINRLRLEIFSGDEHPDPAAAYIRYQIVNDNDDPLSINWSGFHFNNLDYTIESVILPMRHLLEANGERLYLNLNYVDFGRSPFEHYNDPQEYAEFILAAFIHMRDKYGFVPDAVEVILEPDNREHGDGWTGRQVGEALVATARRLEDNGFDVPDFIAPSTTSMRRAAPYFDEMIKVDGVLDYLTEFSYHRYGGVSEDNLRAIADRAAKHNLNASMLEKIGSGYEDLHEDIKIGGVSAWQQYTLAYPGKDEGKGGAYYRFDTSGTEDGRLVMHTKTRFLRQYFKFIRSGAVRIGASTSNQSFDPVAFINENGTYVVVVKANQGGEFTIESLPAGTYGIKYTTPQSYDVDLDDITVTGPTLTTSIPDEGVITIYGKQGL